MNTKNSKHVKPENQNVSDASELNIELTIEEQLEIFADLLIDHLLNTTNENENETLLP